MTLTEKWKKTDRIMLPDILYNPIVKMFEMLTGKEFSSRVIMISSCNAVKNFLNGEKKNNVEKFLKDAIDITLGGKDIKISLNDNGGIVRAKNLLEAKMHDHAEEGVCYICSGIIKAAAEKIIGKPVSVEERKCAAMGNDFCEFLVKPAK